MISRRSLRFRLLLGSLLWTAGLVFIAHLVAIFIVHWFFEGRPVAISRFTFRFSAALFTLGALGLMAAGFLQVRRGLSALDRLRTRLSAVRDGRTPRLEGSYPTEVQPLVADLNALLEHREGLVRSALAKAGDLAHGLKTPLAVLAQEAERAHGTDREELAATIRQQVERMRRQVEVHLAHARASTAGASPGARVSVAASAEGLARTLSRLHADSKLAIRVVAAPDHWVRGRREDLDEMLGNLFDNACHWAQSRVEIASSQIETDLVISVEDDGPGIAAELRDQVLQRGVRADETAPGSGLGLAIVRDLAEMYGGSIGLDESPLGGLRARLRLPGA